MDELGDMLSVADFQITTPIILPGH
jgi:hypothetical protein